MIERERKYRLSSAAANALVARLEKDGRLVGQEKQDTVLLEDRATRLRKGTLVRLRTVDGRRELTFKGKKRTNGFDKTRIELTVELGDGPVLDLLAEFGFVPGLRYVKRTKIYRFRKVLVAVDEVEGVGRFCEIECGDEETSDLDAIARDLGLESDTFEPRGYPSLVAESVAARA